MNKSLRLIFSLATVAAAVASHAVLLAFNGTKTGVAAIAPSSTVVPSAGPTGDFFGFTTSTLNLVTAGSGTIVLTDGTNSLTVSYTASALTFGNLTTASTPAATITAASAGYTGYIGNTVSVTTNVLNSQLDKNKTTFVSVLGEVQAVPEPASMIALSMGAAALLRRRKKA